MGKKQPSGNAVPSRKEMTFDFEGLIQLLAGHLYSEKKVFIRELIQNAHDAIQRRVAADPKFDRESGRIDILTDLTSNPARMIFRDNGIGMTRDDLERFLSTIGKSGTRASSGEAPDVIGQFGIGFLSGFVVAKRVEVTTRHLHENDSTNACRWENDGSKDYTITRCDKDTTGTDVVIELRNAEDRGLLHDDVIKGVIRDYADMLRIRIYVNDPEHHGQPANTMNMPWERENIREEEMRLDCMIYLEKSMPDSVLEIIRVNETGDIRASGLLYITRTRRLATDAPRSVRVFQKRMFLCEGEKELLPPWATFVNGILNTPDLSPNAARDNFTRDEKWRRLRDRLGDLIVNHFEKLREQTPQRLSEILAYHDLAIKAACFYYSPFFAKFGHLLEWRVNSNSRAVSTSDSRTGRRPANYGDQAAYGWATLPDIIRGLPEAHSSTGGSGARRLACFTTSSSANQYFEMANAANTTVVDASYPFEEELIKAYADQHRDEVILAYVDREDDLAVFRDLDADSDRSVAQLAQAMSALIRVGGRARLRVEARRFEPTTLHAVLKDTDAGRGVRKAQEILNDPNAGLDVRTMAEELLKMRMNADLRMTINASSPLIRDLATLDLNDEDVIDLMIGVYNDAILYNMEMMTPRNAKLFHEQFQRLMARGIMFARQRSELEEERRHLAKERERQKPERRTARNHLIAFLMTPYAPEFQSAIEGIRRLVENEFGCQLLIAADRQYSDRILENVRDHIADADVFIADVTNANPNVMHELGAARFGRPDCPMMLVARKSDSGASLDLPADLAGHIAATYPANARPQEVADALRHGFRNNVRFEEKLKISQLEPFVSPGKLREILQTQISLPDQAYDDLSRALPTVHAWMQATPEVVAKALGTERAIFAVPIISLVQKSEQSRT